MYKPFKQLRTSGANTKIASRPSTKLQGTPASKSIAARTNLIIECPACHFANQPAAITIKIAAPVAIHVCPVSATCPAIGITNTPAAPTKVNIATNHNITMLKKLYRYLLN